MVSYITLQEMFNKVWERAKIKVTAYNDDLEVCAYRAKDGNCCFIGVCIPDKDYKPSLEGESVSSNLVHSIFPNISWQVMKELQMIHDSVDPSGWEIALRAFAREYNLTIPE